MSEMSRTFNFDDFDAQIAEALEENEAVMRPIRVHPGQIGGAACKPTLIELPVPEEIEPIST